MVEFKDVDLFKRADVQFGYQLGILPKTQHQVLLVRIGGVVDGPRNEDGLDAYDLGSAVVVAGLEAWRSLALILDLRQLDYAWGARMQNVLTAASRWYAAEYEYIQAEGGDGTPAELPLAVLASDRCRAGLATLLRDEMGDDPSQVLFDDVDGAVRMLDEALEKMPLL